MSDEYFLKLIHKHRFYILFCMLIGMGAGFGVSKKYNRYNSAFSTIYITPQPELEFQGDVHNAVKEVGSTSYEAFAVQQMYLLSNEMDWALIKKFNLFDHYKIDPHSPYAYEKIAGILHNQLQLKATFVIPLFEVTFKDPDLNFAVSVVNFTVNKLQQMNKAAIVERLNQKIQLYKLIITSVNDQSVKISDRLADQIKAFSEIVKSNKFDQHEYENLLNFQNSLVSLTTDLRSVNQSMVNANNVYQMAEKSMKDDDFTIVKQIQRALPRPGNSPISTFGLVGLGFIAGLFTYLLFLYLIVTYKRPLRIIFKGE